MEDILLIEDSGGARLLTLNRPDALNAFNQELWYSLAEAMEQAAVDDDIRCVVLTGSGRAFSAGQDLAEMSDPEVFRDSEPGEERLLPVIESFPKPLLVAVNGIGVGIGLTILLHCDIALMSSEARLKAPFISLGVTTEASASLLLPATMGRQRAAEVLYTEPWLDADDAVDAGLALRKVEPDQLMAETMELAHRIGGLALAPLMATKTLMDQARGDAVRTARERESAMFVHLLSHMSGDS